MGDLLDDFESIRILIESLIFEKNLFTCVVDGGILCGGMVITESKPTSSAYLANSIE